MTVASDGWAVPRTRETARNRPNERESLIVELRDNEGRIGRGEAAPLPGYSPDTISGARTVLEEKRWATPVTVRAVANVRACVQGMPPSVPCARFAIETALLDLLAQRCGESPALLLGGRDVMPPPFAVLVDTLAFEDDIDLAVPLKIKIGRKDRFDAELAFLRLLRKCFGDGLTMRLDANGGLGRGDDLRRRLAILGELRPDFIEEPCPFADLIALTTVPVRIALDESLQRQDVTQCIEALAGRGLCHVLVLKPTTLGGNLRCLELAARAKKVGISAVASPTWEGPIGTGAVRTLAQVLAS